MYSSATIVSGVTKTGQNKTKHMHLIWWVVGHTQVASIAIMMIILFHSSANRIISRV